MTIIGTPQAEHAIDAELVAGLLADQHPDLAGLPLREVDSGWDNALFRLGGELAVRLPRRAAAAPLLAHEQEWLPQLAGELPLPVPAPVRRGAPGRGYPWRWSVVRWLRGAPADRAAPDRSQAEPFGAFLRALHRPAPAGAPANAVRGVPLARRASVFEARLGRLERAAGLVPPAIPALWRAALAAPIDHPPVWLHGDLHPQNLLVEAGAISGVIDWGDITAGDPATDLAAVWMLFAEPATRAAALAAYGPISPATLARARGWAALFGLLLLDNGLVDAPRHALVAERTLRRLAYGDER